MRPKRIASDLSITAKGYTRSVVGLFFSLIFPIILIGIFGLIFSGNGTPPTLYVLNADHNSAASQAFLHILNQTGAVSISFVNGVSVDGFSSYLDAQQYSAGLLIPEGFGAAVATHQNLSLPLYVNPGDQSTAGAAEAAVGYSVSALNLHAANGTEFLTYSTGQIGGRTYTYIDYLVPGLIGFSILTSPMFAMVELTATYRKDGLFRQLSLTPLTRAEWLTSKIFWYAVITIASATIMIVMGYFVLGARLIISWEILPFLFLGPFLFVSLGMLSGSVARTPESAAILGNVITFPMMFLSGTFFPVSSFPPFLQVIARFLPLYYVIDGLNAVMLFGNTARALFDLLVVLALGVIIFIGAILAFRWREE
jgi:ABC-2 type transport system permease protein